MIGVEVEDDEKGRTVTAETITGENISSDDTGMVTGEENAEQDQDKALTTAAPARQSLGDENKHRGDSVKGSTRHSSFNALLTTSTDDEETIDKKEEESILDVCSVSKDMALTASASQQSILVDKKHQGDLAQRGSSNPTTTANTDDEESIPAPTCLEVGTYFRPTALRPGAVSVGSIASYFADADNTMLDDEQPPTTTTAMVDQSGNTVMMASQTTLSSDEPVAVTIGDGVVVAPYYVSHIPEGGFDKSQPQSCMDWRFSTAVIILIISLALGLGLGLGLQSSSSSKSGPTVTPTTSLVPSMAPTTFESVFDSLISNHSSLQVLQDPESAQSRAAEWMISASTRFAGYPQQRLLQLYALACLYFSTNGDSWTLSSWLQQDSNECDWDSIAECDSEQMIREVNLNRVNMTGQLPPELGLLTTLRRIQFRDNTMTGSIPSEVGALTLLTELSLRRNQFSGNLPSQIGLLTKLTELILYENDLLSGQLPTELGRLAAMETMSLRNNRFTGTIPTEFGNLEWIDRLRVNSNQLTGTIPSELSNLSICQILLFQDNSFLAGTLPIEFVALTALTSLQLYNTSVTGNVPQLLCQGTLNPVIDCAALSCSCCVNASDATCSL